MMNPVRSMSHLKRELSFVEYELRRAIRKLLDEQAKTFPKPSTIDRLTQAIDKHKQDRAALKERIAETEYALQPA